MKGHLFVLVLFFCCTSLFSQKKGQARIDSLTGALSSVSADTAKINLLVAIANAYANNNPTEGLRYAEQAIGISQKGKFTKQLIDAHNAAGLNYRIKADFIKSIEYHTKALVIAEELRDKKAMALTLDFIGSSYLYQGLYPKSLEYYLRALQLNETLGYRQGIAANINNLGNVYMYLKDYDRALQYYERGLRMQEETGNKSGIAALSANTGYIFLYQNNFEKALQYIGRAQKLYDETGNIDGSTSNLQAIGRIHQAQHNYLKAIESYDAALKLAEKVGNKIRMAQNVLTVAEVYLLAAKDTAASPFKGELSTRKGLLAIALENTNRAVAIRTDIRDLNGLNFAYDTKSEIESLSGDAVAALLSYQLHIKYRDSVFSLEKTTEINRRELQYEFGKREDSLKYQQALINEQLATQKLFGKQQQQELLLINKEKDLQRLTYLQEQARLQREKEVQASLLEKNKLEARLSEEASDKQIAQQQLQIGFDKKVKLYLGIAMASVVLIAFLIFYNQQKTKKLNKIIGKQKAELEELGQVKDKIFSVVSHDMRTPVNTLLAFIDILQNANISTDKLQTYAAVLKNQLLHTSVLMENLLNWASSQMKGFLPALEPVAVKQLAEETIALLQQQATHKNIRILNKTPSAIWVTADKNMLALVIRNTLSNAVKFTAANGIIVIGAINENDTTAITVTDNGTGMPLAKVTNFNDPQYLHSIDTKRGTQGETGTGLGLMLCKTFVALMNGNMHVSSKEGKGSVFTIILPRA